MRDHHSPETCASRARDVVWGISDHHGPTWDQVRSVLALVAAGDDPGKTEPVTFVGTVSPDLQVELAPKIQRLNLDLGRDSQVPGENRLHEALPVQLGDTVCDAGIRRLDVSKLVAAGLHDLSQDLMEAGDAGFGIGRSDARSDRSVDHDGL